MLAGQPLASAPLSSQQQSQTTYTLYGVAGTYQVQGQSATFNETYTMAAGQGTYALTGGMAAMNLAYLMTASPGFYTLSGSGQVEDDRVVNAETGVFTTQGNASGSYSHVLPATTGTYGIAITATMTRAFVVRAQTVSFALTLPPVVARATRIIPERMGIFNVIGAASKLAPLHLVVGKAAQYFLSPPPITLTRVREGFVYPGVYAYTGSASATYRRTAMPPVLVFAVQGQPVQLNRRRYILTGQGTFTTQGVPAKLSHGYQFNGAPGVYVVTGRDSTQSRARHLVCQTGVYATFGSLATIITTALTAIGTGYRYVVQVGMQPARLVQAVPSPVTSPVNGLLGATGQYNTQGTIGGLGRVMIGQPGIYRIAA